MTSISAHWETRAWGCPRCGGVSVRHSPSHSALHEVTCVHRRWAEVLSSVSDWAAYHVPSPAPGALRDSGGLCLRAGAARGKAAISS